MVPMTDRHPRALVALYGGIVLGVLLVVVGTSLVIQAYVPPQDIAPGPGSNGAPIPFFETIEPVPFATAILGAVLVLVSFSGVLIGRARRRW